MKYAMCPKCGRRLCKGENGTKVEMECPKCGEFASVIIEEDDIHISKKPIFTPTEVSAKLCKRSGLCGRRVFGNKL